MIQKKYAYCLVILTLNTHLILAQIDCPDFKIRGNRSPRSNSFTTAIKFQLDGIGQFKGEKEKPEGFSRLSFHPAFSMGVEQTLHRKLSLTIMHGWTLRQGAANSRFLLGDVRFYFNRTFEGHWLSARQTFTDGGQLQHFTSVHWGRSTKNRFIFSHYETGIGYSYPRTVQFILGINTGLMLNK